LKDSVFYKFEEQCYFQESLFWYGFVVPASTTSDRKNYVVSIVPQTKVANILKNIEDCVQNALVKTTLSHALPPSL